MNSLTEIIHHGGLVLDCLGIVGLGLLALAALRLARVHRSWGGQLLAGGAIALLVGRLCVVLMPHLISNELLASLGPGFISARFALPVISLTLGLAGIVWGLWGHERWMREGR